MFSLKHFLSIGAMFCVNLGAVEMPKFSPISNDGALNFLLGSEQYIQALSTVQRDGKVLEKYGRGYDLQYRIVAKSCDRCADGEVEYLIRVSACVGDSFECDGTTGFISSIVHWNTDGANAFSYDVIEAEPKNVYLNCSVLGSPKGMIVYQKFDQTWQTLDSFRSGQAATAYIDELKRDGDCRTFTFEETN